MKKIFILSIIFLSAAGIYAAERIQNVEQLIEWLSRMERYNASAEYSVLLPSATDEITYTVDLQSVANRSDSLSPCEYLIDWSLPTPSGVSSGFSSYSSGSHYRYRNERLQEYHYDWDSIPFLTSDGGVQCNAQFAELLPQMIARQLKEVVSSPDYEYTFEQSVPYNGHHAFRIDAKKTSQGYVTREAVYLFDNATGRPLRIHIESNPGEISEQEMTVNFGVANADPIPDFSEDALIDRYPEIFEKFRQSNFRVENLAGTALPSFSLPTLGGERYSHERNEGFDSSTIIAVLDPSVASTPETIATLRTSIDILPYSVDIIWAFISNNAEIIENLIGEVADNEIVLTSAKSLARDTGINSYPTILFVNRQGTITGIQLGYNKSLSEIVMQKTATL